ncbi:Cilia- and flagella-associated protein 46 (Tetratricopeptide repeat protein 40) [Durusdinium trenchii]|uniref:Cilia- and flagella-associated protein 46 (Tetratricopeptide repeat protein 40) n=1 Tax=Durusdinium trenchii TaxID=1381693 RepID=A0ABP0HSG3_9DINO
MEREVFARVSKVLRGLGGQLQPASSGSRKVQGDASWVGPTGKVLATSKGEHQAEDSRVEDGDEECHSSEKDTRGEILTEDKRSAMFRQEVRECFAQLERLEGFRTVVELLVMCAEAAMALQDRELAKEAVRKLFAQLESKDQFFCRGLMVKALLEDGTARESEGTASVKHTMKAIAHLSQALEICMDPTTRPSYDFLVYNASVQMFRVVRPLMRDGLRSEAIPALRAVTDALGAIKTPALLWRARLSMSLGLCLFEKGEQAPAQAEVKRAMDLIKQQQEEQREEQGGSGEDAQEAQRLMREAEALAIHLGGAASVAQAKTQRANGLVRPLLQCIRSDLIQGDDAVATELDESLNQVSGQPTEQQDAGALVEVARLALRHGVLETATHALQALCKLPGRQVSAVDEVLSDLVKAEWLAVDPKASLERLSLSNGAGSKPKQGKGECNPKTLRLAKKIQAMRMIDRALLSCMRLDRPEVLEEGCILAWNVGLELLQPHLRSHVHKTFQTAADALESIDSSQVNLRAHLHSEIAKCEVASDFLTKATVQVTKARALDASVQAAAGSGTESEAKDASTLEQFLKPLQAKLDLKSNLYSEPETNFEQALLQVEQAKDAKERHLKKSLLHRAATLLSSPEENGTVDPDAVTAVAEPKHIFLLWGEIAKLAWEQKLVDLATRACDFLLDDPENRGLERDDELQRMAFELNLIRAELFAFKVQQTEIHPMCPLVANLNPKALGLEVPEVNMDAESDFPVGEPAPGATTTQAPPRVNIVSQSDMHLDWPVGEDVPFPEDLSENKRQVCVNLQEALKLGIEMQSSWMIENATIYTWNFHLHMFNGPLQRFQFMQPALRETLNACFDALDSIGHTERSEPMFCALGCAVAHAMEAQGDEQGLTRAAEVCEKAAEGAQVRNSKVLLGAWQRIQRKRKSSLPIPAELLEGGFARLELLGLAEELVDSVEKLSILEQQESLFQEHAEQLKGTDPVEKLLQLEVRARVARLAMDLGHESIAERCATSVIGQLPTQFRQRGSVASIKVVTDKRRLVPPRQWRWFSISECVLGQVYAKRADTMTHDKSTQDSLRQQALKHLCVAGEYGTNAALAQLVLDAARAMWNLAVELMGSAATRAILHKPMLSMVKFLATSGEKTDVALRVNMYASLFECFKDEQDWSGGLACVEHAFRFVPLELQKRLWEARVIFSSKLNKDVAAGLHKMKEGTNALQAKAWATLARASSSASDQMHAYVQALELVKESFEQVEYLIEFAEWLHANHFSRDDVTQCLVAAADVILDVEVAEEKRRAAEQERREKSGKTTGSPTSLSSKMTSMTQRSNMRGGGKPVTKAVRQLGDPLEDAPETLQVEHYLKLVQIFTMLARSVAHSRIRSDMALIAHGHLMTVWKRFIHTTLEGESSDTFLEMILFETEIALEQVERVERHALVLHYLLELGQLLEECAQDPLSIGCYAMMEGLSRAVNDDAFAMLAALKSVRVLGQLNLGELARRKMATVSLELSEPVRVRFSIEVEQILEQRRLRAEQDKEKGATGVAADELIENAATFETETKQVSKVRAPTRRKILEQLKIREVWALAASEMIDLGYIYHAKVFLQEVDRHNEAFEDLENSARTNLSLTRIANLEGKSSVAMEHALKGMRALHDFGGGNALEWERITTTVVRCLGEANRSREVRTLLQDAVTAFETKLEGQGTLKDLDLEVAASQVETLLAEELLRDVLGRCSTGATWTEEWRQCQTHMRNAQDRILIATKPNCVSIATVDVLLRQARLWAQVSQAAGMKTLHDEAFEKIMDGLNRASRCAESMLQMVRPTVVAFCRVPGLSLPLERLLGSIQLTLGDTELSNSAIKASQTSSPAQQAEGQRDVDDKGGALNPVEEWLLATAPPVELKEADRIARATHRACSHFMGAFRLFEGVQVLQSQAKLAAGRGLGRVHHPEASSILQDALDSALQAKQFDVAGSAAFELLRLNPVARNLVLFQSCQARKHLLKLVQTCAADPESKLACLLRLRDHLTSKLVDPSFAKECEEEWKSTTWPFLQVEKSLKRSVVMQRLDCSKPVEVITRSLPPTSQFLVLALSPDNRTLYGTLLSRGIGDPEVVEHDLGENAVDRLGSLISRMGSFKKRLGPLLLTQGDCASFDFDDDGDEQLNLELRELVSDCKAFLGPVIAGLVATTEESEDEEQLEEAESQALRDLIIVADPSSLGKLPLEALVSAKSFSSVVRDFSLHMHYHRIKSVLGNPEDPATDDAPDVSVPGIPTAGKFVVDPRGEDARVGQVFKEAQPNGWSGVEGGGEAGILSRGGFQSLLVADKNPMVFFYAGLGPLLAHYPSSALIGVNLSHCHACILVDRSSNDVSFRNLAKRHGHISPARQELEQSLETAAVLSLAGVNSVVLNQWPNSVTANLAVQKDLCEAVSSASKLHAVARQLRMEQAAKAEENKFKFRVAFNLVQFGLPC